MALKIRRRVSYSRTITDQPRITSNDIVLLHHYKPLLLLLHCTLDVDLIHRRQQQSLHLEESCLPPRSLPSQAILMITNNNSYHNNAIQHTKDTILGNMRLTGRPHHRLLHLHSTNNHRIIIILVDLVVITEKGSLGSLGITHLLAHHHPIIINLTTTSIAIIAIRRLPSAQIIPVILDPTIPPLLLLLHIPTITHQCINSSSSHNPLKTLFLAVPTLLEPLAARAIIDPPVSPVVKEDTGLGLPS